MKAGWRRYFFPYLKEKKVVLAFEGYEGRIHLTFQKQKTESGYFAFKCDHMQNQQ